MNKPETKITVSELLYLAAVGIILAGKTTGIYDGQQAFYAVVLVGILLIAVKMMSQKHSILELILDFMLVSLGGAVYINTGDKGLLIFFILFAGARRVSKERIIQTALMSMSVIAAIMVIISNTGIYRDVISIRYKFSFMGLMVRRCFGSTNPNVFHTCLFLIILFALYLIKDCSRKQMLAISVFFMALNSLLFLYTISLTGVISITFMLIVNLFLYQHPVQYSLPERLIYGAAIVLFVIMPVAAALMLKGDLFDTVNRIVGTRLYLTRFYYENVKITLLGSRFTPPDYGYYFIDDAFWYLFLQLGVLPFLVIMSLMTLYIHKAFKDGSRSDLVLVLSLCFIGMSDPFLFNTSCKNVLFILMGIMVYQYTEKLNVKFAASDNRFLRLLSKEIRVLPDLEKEVNPAFYIYCYYRKAIEGIYGVWTFVKSVTGWKSYVILYGVPILSGLLYCLVPELFLVSVIGRRDRQILYEFDSPELEAGQLPLRTGVMAGVLAAFLIILVIWMIKGRNRDMTNRVKCG